MNGTITAIGYIDSIEQVPAEQEGQRAIRVKYVFNNTPYELTKQFGPTVKYRDAEEQAIKEYELEVDRLRNGGSK